MLSVAVASSPQSIIALQQFDGSFVFSEQVSSQIHELIV
jgi:hypothetical protein